MHQMDLVRDDLNLLKELESLLGSEVGYRVYITMADRVFGTIARVVECRIIEQLMEESSKGQQIR